MPTCSTHFINKAKQFLIIFDIPGCRVKKKERRPLEKPICFITNVPLLVASISSACLMPSSASIIKSESPDEATLLLYVVQRVLFNSSIVFFKLNLSSDWLCRGKFFPHILETKQSVGIFSCMLSFVMLVAFDNVLYKLLFSWSLEHDCASKFIVLTNSCGLEVYNKQFVQNLCVRNDKRTELIFQSRWF